MASRTLSCTLLASPAMLVVVAAHFSAAPLVAQGTPSSIAGTVHDSTGFGLQSAEIRVRGSSARAQTNERGEYRLPSVPVGDIIMEVRRFGFQPIELELVTRDGEARTINVELLLLPPVLDTVETFAEIKVEPMAEFEARRKRYYGVFYTRADIERRAPARPSDLLRSAPGVRVMGSGMGGYQVLMGRSRCRPMYWVDGRVVPMFEIDHLNTNEIQAVEVYRGPSETPPELNRMNAGCGVIAIWTRSTAADRLDAARAAQKEAERRPREDGPGTPTGS
jgi:hypothetical protein